ncbi:MAG: hydroxyisourate hydrolase [Rhizobacter sp.]
MATLSTHVLDTMNGCPANGMAVALYRVDADAVTLLHQHVLNGNGRAPELTQAASNLATGRYRLVFQVAAYFLVRGVTLPEPPFLDEVGVDFGIAEASGHYHVPLLASPWAYSTYRGS